MREIKFRGKKFCQDEWIYGSLITRGEQGADGNFIDTGRGSCYPLQQDTIGQFTGLQDSKGNDIYEGDILCITQHELDILRGAFREIEIICVVEFRNGAFIPVMSNGKGYCWSNFIYDKMPTADYTVIGNIHDNPELMEAKQ